MNDSSVSLMSRFKEFNENFDKKTRELRIFETILPFIVYFVYFLLFEMQFSFWKYYVSYDLIDFITLAKVSVPAILSISGFLWLLPKTAQLIAFPILTVFWFVYSIAQLCVVKSNSAMFRLVNVFAGGDALDFADSVIAGMPVLIWVTLGVMLILAAAVEIIVLKKSVVSDNSKVRIIKTAAAAVIFAACLSYTTLHTPSKDYSFGEYIFEHFTDNESVYNMSDLYTYLVQDVKNTATRNLRAEEDMEMVDEYFANKPKHHENDMTGIFKDKNLLIIQLESYENKLMTEELSPNLMKIREKSIVFENYYGMRHGSLPTFGNEVALNTGLYSTGSFNASTDMVNVDLPYTLANVFRSNGYTPNVYHMNTGHFYNRSESELAFGYDKYTSLRDLTNQDLLFEDDSVVASCDDIYEKLVGGDNFMNYFIGYSAHPPYTKDNRAYKEAITRHPGLINEENPSDEEVYTILATLTDDMAGMLVDRMEKDGSLDNTVILFVADHASLISRRGIGEYELSIQNIPCFIYAKDIQPQTVSKVCSNIDLLPTLINLFGFESSGMYIGNDIFDPDYEGLAYLANMNWVTNKCICVNGKVVKKFTDEEISDKYVEQTSETVRENVEVNSLILYMDYFGKRKTDNTT